MAWAILHIFDQALGLAGKLQDLVDHVQIGQGAVAADVIDFALAAFFQNGSDAAAMIVDIEPVAHLLAIAIDRQRPVLEGIGDHQRNQLFGKLIRTVIVGRARDQHRHLVSDEVRPGQQIGPGFGGGIRAAGIEREILGRLRAARSRLP